MDPPAFTNLAIYAIYAIMVRGRRPKERNAQLIADLHRLMVRSRWNQAELAQRLGVSPSTVTRALHSQRVSQSFGERAQQLIAASGGSSPAVDQQTDQELHLLQKTYKLLLKLDGKLEAVLAEQRTASSGSERR